MNIAVSADDKNLDSQVSEQFEQCIYLLIINVDDLSIVVIKNAELHTNSSNENLAKKILEYNCEAVITGTMNSLAFDILADAGVTRLMGFDCSVEEALELMNKRR